MDSAFAKPARVAGFTLIELSIVLVIIGLVVGGILVGQDLIRAAAVRAQITQIEKYNTAANTFRGKYGFLPGDINAAAASQFGFQARGTQAGQGDGNGVIEGYQPGCCGFGFLELAGETVLFWEDLSTTGLIEGGFNVATATALPGGLSTVTASTSPSISQLLPAAKIRSGDYIYVHSWGIVNGQGAQVPINYFGLCVVNQLNPYVSSSYTNPGVTVSEAYSIDAKVDDGLPLSGNVQAFYLNNYSTWAPAYLNGGLWTNYTNYPGTINSEGYSSTCFDNSTSADGKTAVNGNPQHYSVEINGGSNNTCGLSIRMQAGD